MYLKVYYNYEQNRFGTLLAQRRGYKNGDRLVEVWEDNIPNAPCIKTADNIFNYINSLDEFSIPKVLGLVDMRRGDVIYFVDKEKAYARTPSAWRYIKDFKVPPPVTFGFGYQNRNWERNS